ncbi:DUF4870 domain-containing protein [Pedobacter cryoconitis]|uniref:Putative membrane protein n=1 Tax=Pedobacter cryoconitis TaxID=188932 RepID=A0A7X0J162_9SPHI|nr:DUF4870 domain-containing protein [Pedobacter cryoconitis]MBB6499195.1 putative membrane protein [Pedobacter cryoconitis]
MNNKTLSILSYVTIIGWLIAYFSYKKEKTEDTLVRYHLEQGLGIFILSALLNIALRIVSQITPELASALSVLGYVVIVLWVFGIINAINEQKKPVPLFGKMFEGKFSFIP